MDHVDLVVQELKGREDPFHDLGALEVTKFDPIFELFQRLEAQFHLHYQVVGVVLFLSLWVHLDNVGVLQLLGQQVVLILEG